MAIKYNVVPKKNPSQPTAPAKYYGQAVHPEKINFKQLSIEIAETSTTVSDGDAYATLITASKLVRKYLEKGYIVELEDIGTFYINISSDGAETPEKFHHGLIRSAKVIFKSGKAFAAMLKSVVYEKIKQTSSE